MSDELKEIVKEHVNTIRKTSLFQGLPMEDLVKFLVKCRHNELKTGDTVYSEGEPSSSMAIALTGQVNIYKDDSKICTLETPVLIGEIGLFTEAPRNATVKANEDGIYLTITHDDLNYFFRKEPKLSQMIYRNIILSLRNKINNDNQQIIALQEGLNQKKEEIIKLKVSLKQKDIAEGGEPPSEEKKDILPAEKRLLRNNRKSIRVAITNQKYCYIKIGRATVVVKDLSLGGISIDLSTVKEEIKKGWKEGESIRGEIFFQGQSSFPFSGTIRNFFPSSCGIQFDKLSYIQENAIIKTVNELQRLGQVI